MYDVKLWCLQSCWSKCSSGRPYLLNRSFLSLSPCAWKTQHLISSDADIERVPGWRTAVVQFCGQPFLGGMFILLKLCECFFVLIISICMHVFSICELISVKFTEDAGWYSVKHRHMSQQPISITRG